MAEKISPKTSVFMNFWHRTYVPLFHSWLSPLLFPAMFLYAIMRPMPPVNVSTVEVFAIEDGKLRRVTTTKDIAVEKWFLTESTYIGDRLLNFRRGDSQTVKVALARPFSLATSQGQRVLGDLITETLDESSSESRKGVSKSVECKTDTASGKTLWRCWYDAKVLFSGTMDSIRAVRIGIDWIPLEPDSKHEQLGAIDDIALVIDDGKEATK